MRILVCGGRTFSSSGLLWETLFPYLSDYGPDHLTIIHGGCRGADRLAGNWAAKHNIPCEVFYPEWDTHGKAAGPIRNQRMLDVGHPDLVLAFPGGIGTADMIGRAKIAGVLVREIK